MVSDPFYSEGVAHLVNPTNGSWWIVQIFSNWSALSFCSPLSTLLEDREDLNHPPTAVGGISLTLRVRPSRKDLNNPLTAVSGIFAFCGKLPATMNSRRQCNATRISLALLG